MNKTAVITGATSGIGEATAKLFANNNIDLILCGRRVDRLEKIRLELASKVKVKTLCFDVRDKLEIEKHFSSLEAPFNNIDILLNNAGNAHGLDLIQDGDDNDWEAMIDINVKGLLNVSKVVIPKMIKQRAGHIINIGSIAGKEAYAKGNVYCATKAAVDALTKGMRIDLNTFGIKVSEVAPGAVNTEFSAVRFKGDKERADSVYNGFEPLLAEDIAEIILFMVTRPKHVNIAELLVLPNAQANATTFNRQA